MQLFLNLKSLYSCFVFYFKNYYVAVFEFKNRYIAVFDFKYHDVGSCFLI